MNFFLPMTPATTGPDPDAFPVRLIYDESAGIGRLWGLLWLGMAVRALLLIPHFIVLYILGIVAGILMVFTWVPVPRSRRTSSMASGRVSFTPSIRAYSKVMRRLLRAPG